MKAAGFLGLDTDLENPDFAAMARAMGFLSVRVDDPGNLPVAVTQVLAHDGPAVLDVVTRQAGTLHAADHWPRVGQGFRPLDDPCGDERSR
ncbi:thiamine pyrophosphate-dependent acetolactate synthase large subunit-like protein [Ancylobacter sp. 3268]|nr:thiamine pyrophosphate-dependent acetolactate synthase large subunit-like protein [Ancylobacter sp. 3268]